LVRQRAVNHTPDVVDARPSVFTDSLKILQRPEQDLRQGVSRRGVPEDVKRARPPADQPDEDL
jgi:hypothetical protein